MSGSHCLSTVLWPTNMTETDQAEIDYHSWEEVYQLVELTKKQCKVASLDVTSLYVNVVRSETIDNLGQQSPGNEIYLGILIAIMEKFIDLQTEFPIFI